MEHGGGVALRGGFAIKESGAIPIRRGGRTRRHCVRVPLGQLRDCASTCSTRASGERVVDKQTITARPPIEFLAELIPRAFGFSTVFSNDNFRPSSFLFSFFFLFKA